jgi:AcrR family transcriptional regulator
MSKYDEQKKTTHEKIIKSFWDLYQNKYLDAITVRDITEKCQINRSTFYRHFTDIHSILSEVEDNLIQKIKKFAPTILAKDKDFTIYLQDIYDLFLEDADYLQVLIKERRDPNFAVSYKKAVIAKIPPIFYLPADEKNTIAASIVIEKTYDIMIELIIEWADDPLFSFSDILGIIRGCTLKGIYPTLSTLYNIKQIFQTDSTEFFQK